MRIVLDTNVLVSALLKQGTPPEQVLSLVVAGRLSLVVESRIVAEYRAVLARPAFGFASSDLEHVVRVIERSEWVVAAPLRLGLPDEGDLPFLEVAIAASADALVTGNVKHFRVRGTRLSLAIVTPRQLLDLLR